METNTASDMVDITTPSQSMTGILIKLHKKSNSSSHDTLEKISKLHDNS